MEGRTQRLKKRLLDAPFEICAERAVLWTESQRATANRPQVVRNALALKHLLDNMTVAIREDELVVGTRTSKLRGSPLFPEIKSFSIESQLDTYETRPIQPYRVSAEDRRAIRRALPYWRGRSAWEAAFRLMPPDLQCDVFKLTFSVEAEFANGIGHFIVGNHNLLAKGLAGIRNDALANIRAFAGPGWSRRRAFWEAVTITCDAAASFAARYAAEARRLLAAEPDPKRKDELLRIALVCDRVPENPPRDFREALQAVWFNQLICQLECGGFAISPGRLDRLLYPFYKRDLLQGRITADQARELVECLFVKMSEVVNVLDTVLLPVTSGPPIAQSLTIAGTDEEGADATTELTHIFIEAFDNIRTVSPNLAVRFHPGTPADFKKKVYDSVRRGAMMSLFNDEVIVESLKRRGAPEREALGYAIVGCVEPTAAGSAFGSTDSNLVNVARCLELALNNGDGMDLVAERNYLAKNFLSYYKNGKSRPAAVANGKSSNRAMLIKYLAAMARSTRIRPSDLYRMARGKGIGPRTGDARRFSFDDLVRAFRIQVAYAVGRMVDAMEYCDMAHAELKPTPFISSMIDDCIDRGMDVTWGGARYNYTGPQAIGLADAADSLSAIRKLVFDEGRVSMEELLDALHSDFEGAEKLRQTLLNKAPKYGNDDQPADSAAKTSAAIYCSEVSKHPNIRGGKFSPGIYSMSSHIVFGLFTRATPNGRRMGEPLASGVSPSRGVEVKGPTAVLKSVAGLEAPDISNGYVLNMTMNPDLTAGDERLKKFIDLNDAYFRLGGLHVQYNVVDADTLKKAQNNPDMYRGLVVRVAGYSALFTELDRATQNDIISRTAHGCE